MSIFSLGNVTQKLMLLPVLFALSKDDIAMAETPGAPNTNSILATYQIVDRIDDPKRFTTSDAVAYLEVNTKDVPFHIVQYKNGKVGPAYAKKDLDDHKLFPNETSPLAIVEPVSSGLGGAFEIYSFKEHYKCPQYKSGDFCVHFNPKITSTSLSPLIYIPAHTYVSPAYVRVVNSAINELPSTILEHLTKENFKIMIGYDGKECYWKTWSDFETHDKTLKRTSSRSDIRVKKGIWKFNGKFIEALGIFRENKAAVPQRYFQAGTENRIELNTLTTKSTIYHEICHKLNRKGRSDNSSLYSDEEDFKKAYKEDVEKLTEQEEEQVSHLLVNRDEAFATIGGVLLGGYSKERASFVLSKFPDTAKQVAKVLEEQYRFSTSVPLANYEYQRGGISTSFIYELVRKNIGFYLASHTPQQH